MAKLSGEQSDLITSILVSTKLHPERWVIYQNPGSREPMDYGFTELRFKDMDSPDPLISVRLDGTSLESDSALYIGGIAICAISDLHISNQTFLEEIISSIQTKKRNSTIDAALNSVLKKIQS